jgi:Domain of unknown function (DUF1737)
MEYQIVKKTEASELQQEVNALIAKGWKPLGGIAISFGRIRNPESSYKSWIEVLFHVQAMTRE